MNTYNDMYKKVVCLNNNIVFQDLKEASEYSGVDELDIIYCCKEINSYAKDKDDKRLTWRFYEDFMDMDEDSKRAILKEIDEDISEFKDKIICLDTNHIYDNIKDVSKHLGASTRSIRHCCSNRGTYLSDKNKKKHALMYMVDYIKLSEEEKKEAMNSIEDIIDKSVICLNLNKKFDTIDKASKFTGVPVKSIKNNCNRDVYYVRNENREKFIFMYYDNYSKLDDNKKKEEVKEAKLSCITRRSKVICLNNKEVFENIEEASKVIKVSTESIERCCNKQRKYNVRKDGMRFSFMYYTEYRLLNSKERKKVLKKVKETSVKKVVNVETGTVYDSAQEASKHSALSAFTIRQQCNKKENYSLRSKELYPSWLYYEDYCKRLKRGKVPNRKAQLDKTTEEKQPTNEALDEVAVTTN